MSGLRTDTPLEELTRQVARAQDLTRDQGTILSEREAFLDRADSDGADRRKWRVRIGAGVLCLGILGVAAWSLRSKPLPQAFVGPAKVAYGPGAWLAASGRPLPVLFSNGSHLELDPRARLRIAELLPNGGTLTLELGQVRAWIAGDAEPTWRMDAGPFIVRGAQAQFLLSWDPEAQLFEITLSQGAVAVEGPVLGERKLVEAGHSLRVSVPDSLAVLTSLVDDGPTRRK